MTDQGLAAQRTSLAWSRTALAAAAFGALALRIGLAQHRPLDVAAAIAAAVTAGVVWLIAPRGSRRTGHVSIFLVSGCLVVTAAITVAGLLA